MTEKACRRRIWNASRHFFVREAGSRGASALKCRGFHLFFDREDAGRTDPADILIKNRGRRNGTGRGREAALPMRQDLCRTRTHMMIRRILAMAVVCCLLPAVPVCAAGTESAELYDLSAGASVETAQGFCMWEDKGHQYTVAAWIDENHGSYKSYITLYDLTADEELASITNFRIGHANDLTRDVKTGHIFIAAGDNSDYDVLEFDEDLEYLGGYNTGTLSGIAYDAYSDTFYLAGGRWIRQVDRDFNEIDHFTLENWDGRDGGMVTFQGITVFGDYLMTVGASMGNWGSQDINVFYKDDGSHAASYDCDIPREIESYAFWNGKLYCTGNYGRRIKIYEMEVPGITGDEGALDEEKISGSVRVMDTE